MPGLLRGMARTAVIAGTAQAARNRVTRRQAERWAQQDPGYAQQGYVEEAPAPQDSPPAPAQDPIAQLERLGELRDKGVLTEEEFAAQKAKLLD